MRSASAWAPGNISCIFMICKGKTPSTSGSKGLGFTINKGATVNVNEAKKSEVSYNGKKVNFPTVDHVVSALTRKTIQVRIRSPLPLGAGFGMSGASALGTAYALNKLLELKKSKKELAMIAHCADVESGTGLGDVVNQFYGGFLAKLEPSYTFKVKDVGNAGRKVHCLFLSKISTKGIITDANKKETINKASEHALLDLKKIIKNKKNISFHSLIKISKTFAEQSGLLVEPRVKKIIDRIESEGGNASMIMLGNAVFSDVPFKGSNSFKISNKGGYVL